MNFKLNAFEKFAYRHNLAVPLFTLCLTIAYSVICFNFDRDGKLFFPLSVIFLAYVIPFALVLNSLKKKITMLTNIANNQLDMNSFSEGIDYLISITPKKSKLNSVSAYLNKITVFWNTGDYEHMKYELNCLLQNFNLKKLDASAEFVVHARFAVLALAENDIERYKEEVTVMQTLMGVYGNSKIFGSKLRYTYNDVMLFAGAVLSDESSDEGRFLSDCFASLDFSPVNGKPRKDAVMKIEYLDLHYKLFLFFKNRNDLEKARYHALMLTEIGNVQLKAYRDAKEFFDNENRSN